MKAVVYENYGSTDVLKTREMDTPAVKANEVLIKVAAAVVTPADIAMRSGKPFIARLFAGITKPKQQILGAELSGEIVELGTDVSKFSIGDNVMASTGETMGAHAEYVCLRENEAIMRIPATVELTDAVSLCDGGLTALPFLREKGNVKEGDKVLINGAAGSNGTWGIQLAKFFGAEVTGVCSTSKVELVKSLGADDIIDYTKDDFTESKGKWDIIFDAVGKSAYSKCKQALKPGGAYLTTVPNASIPFQMLWTSMFGKKKAKIAFAGLRSAEKKLIDLEFLKALCEQRAVKPVVDRYYPFNQIVEAYNYVEQGHKSGSVVIKFDD